MYKLIRINVPSPTCLLNPLSVITLMTGLTHGDWEMASDDDKTIIVMVGSGPVNICHCLWSRAGGNRLCACGEEFGNHMVTQEREILANSGRFKFDECGVLPWDIVIMRVQCQKSMSATFLFHTSTL